MAKPVTVSGAKLSVWLGDGGSPESFDNPCGITAKTLTFSKATNEDNVPDCDDPEAPMWTERDVTTLSSQISGSGVLAIEALPVWQAFFASNDSRNVRIVLDHDDAGRWAGAYHLTNFAVTGEIGRKVSLEITLDNDGEVVYEAGLS